MLTAVTLSRSTRRFAYRKTTGRCNGVPNETVETNKIRVTDDETAFSFSIQYPEDKFFRSLMTPRRAKGKEISGIYLSDLKTQFRKSSFTTIAGDGGSRLIDPMTPQNLTFNSAGIVKIRPLS